MSSFQRKNIGRRIKDIKRKPFNRRFNRGRKARIGRGSIQSKVHFYKQTYFPSATSLLVTGGTSTSYVANQGLLYGPQSLAADGYFALKFLASDLPQYTSLAALYDTYKINKLVVKFVPQINSLTAVSTAGSLVSAPQEFMSTVIDYDDATLLTNYTDALQYQTFKETPTYKIHKRVITPKLSMSAFKTSGTTIGYVQKSKQWVDAAYGDVEHYGLKGSIQSNTNSVQQIWKVFVTAYISFKQVR